MKWQFELFRVKMFRTKRNQSNFRYHTDEQIKQTFAEIERKYVTIANFEANDNEISMAFPSLTVTADVREFCVEI